jgi:hypothetical protein
MFAIDLDVSGALACRGDSIIWSEFTDITLGRRWLVKSRGEPNGTRMFSVLPGAEMGEPRCDDSSSMSSKDFFSHPFWTLTMAYESRVRSCADICRMHQPQAIHDASHRLRSTHLSYPRIRAGLSALGSLVSTRRRHGTISREARALHHTTRCSLRPLHEHRRVQ